MRLKCHARIKDGKEHRYWSSVESVRCSRDRVVQRQVLYLGERNDSQREGWTRSLDAVDEQGRSQQLALFPADRQVPGHAQAFGVQVRRAALRLERPRQWGACWLFTELWAQLQLDTFWPPRLPESRAGTCWYHTLVTACAYRLIDPGSAWRRHRLWYEQTALGDLLEEDFSRVAKDNLYRVLDKLLEHKRDLCTHLQARWKDLFGARFDVLLYDLTSTCFEGDPKSGDGLRRFGCSRDKRSDCVPVSIARIVTPAGLPLAYEVLPGNTTDKTTRARLHGENRSAAWQSPSRVGHGPRHPHSRGFASDASRP